MKEIKIACQTVLARFFRIRTPLVVNWLLTYRCNRLCQYCNICHKMCQELDTTQVIDLVKQMAQMGTRRIHFSGGEPLLRDDIGVILKYCKDMRLKTGINTNGSLVPAKIEELRTLDTLCLSLDGPEAVHDSIRGVGSYQEVMAGIKSAKRAGLKVKFKTVLSSVNLGSVDYILDKARELSVPVLFQPATERLLEGSGLNPIVPFGNQYLQIVKRLIREKQKNKYIGNSLPALEYLSHWPVPKSVYCSGGLIFCRIEPDGRLMSCGRNPLEKDTDMNNCMRIGFKKAFLTAPRRCCQECWCSGQLEMNLLASFNVKALVNMLDLMQ